ncbi:MscS Mechanosensitive ion channel [Desulfosarcina cetonica]|uniref:mechanosensitive ion channel family protein n=1 Tax=Desulfosarcina cetonica TaxID=90730 RepID=UPI0006D0BA4A|nr:mechanosensitive ion channel family protein [Desulfosarcina cetonica]VTR66168.1 MscS Mechanosensitive ion channel [Desulfosarcina cetonica]
MELATHYLDWLIALVGSEAPITKSLVYAVTSLVTGWIIWLIAKRTLTLLEKRADHLPLIQVQKEFFAVLRKATGLMLIWLVGVIWIRLLHMTAFERIFHAILIIVAATPIKALLLIVLEYLERNLADRTETHIDNIVIDLLNKFSGAIVYATAVVIALDVIGVNVMPFIAGAGVMGVAVGFAAKDTLSNLIAGILLIIDRPFEIGDRIEVWSAPAGSATWGDVIDIGLRATRIRTTDNIVVIIPNNEIMTRDIVNYTIISTSIRVRVNINVAYDADIAKTKALIIQAAQLADWILRDPPPKVVVRDFGESAVSLQLRVWIQDARRRMDTISHITDTVKSLFEQHDIEIPYPKRDITLISRHREQQKNVQKP